MSISRPKVSIDILPAIETVQNEDQKVLFVGQPTAAGTAPPDQLYENVPSDGSEDTLFGADSMLAKMIRDARKYNKVTRFDAIPTPDNGTGVDATATITFSTGPATVAGTITIYIGSKERKYVIAVEVGDTDTQVGDKLEALITADTYALISASNAAGVVTLTAVNAGEEGNLIGIISDDPIGVSAPPSSPTDTGISVQIAGFSGGANNPVLVVGSTNVFDLAGNNRYQTIIWPNTYTRSVLTDFLDARFNSDNYILDGVGIVGLQDVYSTMVTTLNAADSQSLVLIPNKLGSVYLGWGGAIFEMTYSIAAQFGAVRALRLTQDADITQYVSSSQGALDARGGPGIAAKPYFNTPFYHLPLVAHINQYPDADVDELTTAGGTVLNNNVANNLIIAADTVTTYKTDAASNPDDSFKYLNYVDTSSNIREYFQNNLKVRFEQTRLTEGNLQPGRDMANANLIAGYLTKLFSDLGDPEYALVPKSEASRKFFKDNLTVTLDLELGKVNITMQVPIITQLREIIAEMQIAFSINS